MGRTPSINLIFPQEIGTKDGKTKYGIQKSDQGLWKE